MSTSNGPSDQSNTQKSSFNPKFPASDFVKKLRADVKKAHVTTLSRIANLATPVAGRTAEPQALKDTIDQVVAHGETISFFGDVFSRYHEGTLTREDLDQRLVNWASKIPGMREKFDELPEDVKPSMETFKTLDLTRGSHVTENEQFKFIPNPVSARKSAELKKMCDEQQRLDGWKKYPTVVENDGDKVKYVENFRFENWGETVKNTPSITFIPKSVVGVQSIVKYAKEVGKKVRCSGYRHTWSDLFSDDGEILISLLPLDTAIDLPSIAGPFNPGQGLLQQIEPVTGTASSTGVLCKIGAATTNEQFREWCLSQSGGANQWTLPLNVIMVEITFGGSISPICHGAGITHKTLSDLVAEVEFVNAHGELHTVSDPELLKAAAGAIGLLGIVTAYTLRLDKMTYTAMRPVHIPVELAIPPPKDYIDAAKKGDPHYKFIKNLIAKHSQDTMDKALTDFVSRAENDYYAEWFWFTLQSDVWVNTWNNDGIEAQAQNIPSNFEAWLQWLEEWIAEVIIDWSVFQALPGELQARLLAFITLTQLPNIQDTEPPLTTQLINGLHFRRGIQNLQVYNMEIDIPIPAQKDQPAKRDWTITQKAWWDAILQMESDPSVVRIACEMRIMNGSDVLLAPQRGNTLGTSAVEILTTLNTPTDDWIKFSQQLADKWFSYVDQNGKRVRARSHWCKQWSWLTLPNEQGVRLKAVDWFRQDGYKEEIPLFLDALKKIGEGAGFTVDDVRQRFANAYLDTIFFGAPAPIVEVEQSDDLSRRIINGIKKFFQSCFR